MAMENNRIQKEITGQKSRKKRNLGRPWGRWHESVTDYII
jgi:hypothetical protein